MIKKAGDSYNCTYQYTTLRGLIFHKALDLIFISRELKRQLSVVGSTAMFAALVAIKSIKNKAHFLNYYRPNYDLNRSSF
jgi:hypothetical protein